MSKIQLFIAASIDGFIAREDGSLDWLDSLPNPDKIDHGYHKFYKEIDTVLIGRHTYEEVLKFGVDWPYANCNTYVVSRNKDFKVKTENTELLYEINKDTINKLRKESEKNIWIVGGGKLITAFLNEDAIDEMTICMIPTIIGKGLPLFPNDPKEARFELVSAETFETGVVNLTYKRQ